MKSFVTKVVWCVSLVEEASMMWVLWDSSQAVYIDKMNNQMLIACRLLNVPMTPKTRSRDRVKTFAGFLSDQCISISA